MKLPKFLQKQNIILSKIFTFRPTASTLSILRQWHVRNVLFQFCEPFSFTFTVQCFNERDKFKVYLIKIKRVCNNMHLLSNSHSDFPKVSYVIEYLPTTIGGKTMMARYRV